MKTLNKTRAVATDPFERLPTDYLHLCQGYVPRPLHDATDYTAACQAIEPLAGFEDRLTDDQADYLEAVSSFIEAFDREAVTWPKGQPLDAFRFLLDQHHLTAADLSRLLGSDRSLGAKILQNERRLTTDHLRVLTRHFNVEPGLFLTPAACLDATRGTF